MSDPFESDLSHLAPDIDLDRAHQAFEATRSRRRNRRRTAGGLGGAALAAALVAGVIATGGDGTESVTADGPIRFGPSLTGTVADLADCAEQAADIDALVFLVPGLDDSARQVIEELVRSFDADASFVDESAALQELVDQVAPHEPVGAGHQRGSAQADSTAAS